MIDSGTKDELNGAHGWRALEATLRPFIASRVSGADVDDVVQDVFLKLHRGLEHLRDDQRFGPWVYQVARNAIVDHRRRSARDRVTTRDEAEPEPTVEPLLPHSGGERALAGRCARLFVSMLPSPYREALTLTELEGLTQTAAAEMMGISVSGMKSRVQRGRKQLRASLEGCCTVALDGRRRVIGLEPKPEPSPELSPETAALQQCCDGPACGNDEA